MEKAKLERFINKYNLGGACESVTWTSDGNKLSVTSASGDKNVISSVSVDKIGFPVGEFSVYDTKKFKSMLNVLSDNITVTPNGNTRLTSLTVDDGNTKATIVLADSSIIPPAPILNKIPPINITVKLDEKFTNTFVRAKGALSEVSSFTVTSDGTDTNASVILGYSANNTNRITIVAKTTESTKLDPIRFSANYLREILTVNKEATEGTLEISSKGMCIVKFAHIDGFATTYYLLPTTV